MFQESDRESSVGSPEPASTIGVDGATNIYQNPQLLMMNAALQNRTVASGVKSEQDDLDHAKAAAAAAAHLNGTSQFYKKMTPLPSEEKD